MCWLKKNLLHTLIWGPVHYTELILGCGSVMITLFCNIGPKFQVPCVAISALCRDLAHNLFYSSYSVDFRRSSPLARRDFYWLILNWAFLLSFLTKWLSHFCEMRCRNLIMTVCKCAHRNLKLQLYLVWPTAKKFECIMVIKDDEWPGRKMNISEEIELSSTNHGHIRYVPFS